MLVLHVDTEPDFIHDLDYGNAMVIITCSSGLKMGLQRVFTP